MLGIVIGFSIGYEKIRAAVLTWLRSHVTSKENGKNRRVAKKTERKDDC
jgi:hypothetical protein